MGLIPAEVHELAECMDALYKATKTSTCVHFDAGEIRVLVDTKPCGLLVLHDGETWSFEPTA